MPTRRPERALRKLRGIQGSHGGSCRWLHVIGAAAVSSPGPSPSSSPPLPIPYLLFNPSPPLPSPPPTLALALYSPSPLIALLTWTCRFRVAQAAVSGGPIVRQRGGDGQGAIVRQPEQQWQAAL